VSRRRILLVILAAALAVTGTACAGGGGDYEITAEFDRSFNLFEGSRVRMLGVEIGTVEEIEIRPGMDTVRTRLRIDGDVDLPAEVEASIIFASMLGERHIELHPPYQDGATLDEGAHIPLDRTSVPAEFDEVLESLNDFLAGLPPEEVARVVTNAAEILDGRGEELGETIEDVAELVEVLREVDEDVISLAGRLADLNTTLASRDAEIGRIIADWDTVVSMLATERDTIDAALSGVARISAELGDLLATNRSNLESDVQTLTRILRTADRNVDELDLLLTGQSELYRHAERVFDFDRNWLPLVNHAEDLGRLIADRLTDRLVRACDDLGLEVCADVEFWESNDLPEELCLPPLVPCPDDGSGTSLSDALRDATELVPELSERLEGEDAGEEDEEDDLTDQLPLPSLRGTR
jgi:phospholipid/cholesterol/gamma-HCH transport system substrate-binding protein